MPQIKNPVCISIGGATFTFRQSDIDAIPDMKSFLVDLLARGVSAPVAGTYSKLAARLKRRGRLADPTLITHAIERTAANAYRRWTDEAYGLRIAPVRQALAMSGVREHIPWLRRHALVPPYDGKMVPRLAAMPTIYLDAETKTATGEPARYEMRPCAEWTLHVPLSAKVPVHEDPCKTCGVIDLTPTQLEAIAVGFENAWGHRDLSKVPPECFLFGQPPAEAQIEKLIAPAERVVAVLPKTELASAIEQRRGVVVHDATLFLEALRAGAGVVVLSRAAIGADLEAVLDAVRAAWTTIGVAQ